MAHTNSYKDAGRVSTISEGQIFLGALIDKVSPL